MILLFDNTHPHTVGQTCLTGYNHVSAIVNAGEELIGIVDAASQLNLIVADSAVGRIENLDLTLA